MTNGARKMSPFGYIFDQEQHHMKETFQQEFRRLLRKYKMEFDERYVWD
jgi:hypothetical protein